MKQLTLKLLIFLLLFQSGTMLAQSKPAQAGYYRTMVGQVEVIALSDGTVPVDAHMLLGNSADIDSLLKNAYLKPMVETSINAYLINNGTRHILVDAGAGELFGGKYGGLLVQSLQQAGYRPEQITDILITHVHLDHTGGLVMHNKMVFPNATIHVDKHDIDFWMQHLQAKADDTRGIHANRPAFMTLKTYLDAGKVRPFTGPTQLFEGISTIETPGHTAGHTLFVLASKGEKMVFWGDLVHIAEVQLTLPDNPDEYDFDKDKAARQRVSLYREAAVQQYLVAADHISFPGIGRLRSQGNSYQWLPLHYSIPPVNR